MTTQPSDEQPTPEQRAAEAIARNRDLADVRCLLAAFNAVNHAGVATVTTRICRRDRVVQTLHAMAIQALEWGRELYGEKFQDWLDAAAVQQMDIADYLEQRREDEA